MSTQEYTTSPPMTIPPELAILPQWVARKGKMLINAHTGAAASSTDPTTWGTPEEALAAVARYHLDGIGFVFTANDPYLFIDIDHCIDPATGKIAASAQAMGDRLPGYWEISTSGTGLHGIVRAIKPGDRCRTGNVEMYDQGRFMVWTGRTLPGCETIRNAQAAVTALYHEVFPPEAPRPEPKQPTFSGGNHTNDEIIEAASRVSGEKFRRLHAGDITGYPESQTNKGFSSEADGALAMILCGYTEHDDQVADIMRTSGLSRRKFDRADYLSRTIASARARQNWWYEWDRPTGAPAANPIRQDAFGGGDHADEGDTCPAQLAEARARIRELKATVQQQADTITTLRERVRLGDEREGVYRNTKLSAARQTGAALATLFQTDRQRRDGPDPGLTYRMPLAKLADRTGLSEETCSKHLKQLAQYRTEDGAPVLRAETFEIPFSVDPSTGEITTQHREVWIAPGVEPSAFGHVLATLTPKEAPKHGGPADRNVCPDHPFAGTVKRVRTIRKVTHECAECARVLDRYETPLGKPSTTFTPAPKPMPQDAFADDSGHQSDGDPMPQHAASTTTHSVGKDLSGKMRHSSPLLNPEPSDSRPMPPGVAGDDPYTNAGYVRGAP